MVSSKVKWSRAIQLFKKRQSAVKKIQAAQRGKQNRNKLRIKKKELYKKGKTDIRDGNYYNKYYNNIYVHNNTPINVRSKHIEYRKGYYKEKEKIKQEVLNDLEIDLPQCIYRQKRRVISIGDIHGDFKLMIDCLELGKVIERMPSVKENEYPEDISKYKWIGNKTVVIQVGDQIDRCRPSVSVKCDDPTATPEDEGSDILILEFKLCSNLT